MFFTIKEEKLQEEIVEKKSKFIATLFYVQNENEAQEIIKNVKKQYFDARHNCFAYRIMSENVLVERQSDDGEPSGTAGGPLLNILAKNNLCNVLVIVTRYFGGILLGTGGLVRAYSDAAMKVIQNATLVNETCGYEVEIELEYAQLELFKYYCNKNGINIINIDYQDNIKCIIEVTENEINGLNFDKEKTVKFVEISRISSKNIRKKPSDANG